VNDRILFLGEGTLQGPARYLSAILTWAKFRFDHLPDQNPVPLSWLDRPYRAVILSDYRYSSWKPAARKRLIERIQDGMGLLMIGGWASFTGKVGGYAGTDLEKLLPVRCIPKDDRLQNAGGALLLPNAHAPMVCGYHRAIPKPGTKIENVFKDVLFRNGKLTLGPAKPALVRGHYGRGKTAAFLTDCAPHWAGGLVDWGHQRVRVRFDHDIVEVGDGYLRYFSRLIKSLGART